MTSLYVLHLILVGLMGIHGEIVGVSKVSVKAGGSVSIPCLYESKYRDNVKCLCKGKKWPNCKYVVKTNQLDNSEEFSISDDKNQGIFTVTINHLTDDDSSYWCSVERDVLLDVKKRFELSVTNDVQSLYVDKQEMTAFEGGSVTVWCRYEYPKVTEWCKLGSSSCVTDQTGSIDGATVSINESVPKVFTVTMSELRTKNSGWYCCANTDFQMPVHITVHELTSTTATTMSPNTANFTGTRQTANQNSSLFMSAEQHTVQPTNSTINGAGGESLQDKHKSLTIVTIFTATLVLLVVLAAFVGYRIMIKRNNTKTEGPDITAGSKIGNDPDVHYATVVHNQHPAAQHKNNIPEEIVTYSTILIKESVRQTTEPVDGSVIYNTIQTKTE
ncbi:uncharacterized protein LOC115019718 isoform X2 [Cottoperca gobio]|uniref:Uncharacterized protein LOC115019718 isoform X2 n=1 Tax=Cottoperca gobio TaxID=56716 RepID=A0A6J2R4L1_COTGO|nr:uncharacterized protein LOC115019718 isoform X2 [Cottoperca gobio]